MSLTERLLEQSMIARHVKRRFGEHFWVNADGLDGKICEESFSGYIEFTPITQWYQYRYLVTVEH